MSDQLEQSEAIAAWIDARVDGLDIPNNVRVRLAAACLDMALEHHCAILLLTRQGRYGSAAALVRCAFEAYVRGVWLYYCATDAELDRLRHSDRIDKDFRTLIAELEQHEAFNVGVLSQVKDQSWRAMNSMTHGGMQQLSRRMTADEIRPSYTDAEADDAVSSATWMALLAAITVATIAGDENLARAVLDRAKADDVLDSAT